ncbi:MAG: hypothetical protein E7272_07600 [Pseudobutyrivibrio ruminis]|uniref:Uncharacterized protein n=1 Tax=Pseudobutyrivibrio ruminis TaxID=46206 RepID=A0A927YQQ8_9FIRM|nr:hypothetical protein [Pseudobutyrivibrio ruminis]
MELVFARTLLEDDELLQKAKSACSSLNGLNYAPCSIDYKVYEYQVAYTTVRGNYHTYTGYYVGTSKYDIEFEDVENDQRIEMLVKPLRDKYCTLHGVNYFRQIGKVIYEYQKGKSFIDSCTSEDNELIEKLKKVHPKNLCLGGVNLVLWVIDYTYKTSRGNPKVREAFTVANADESAAIKAVEANIKKFNEAHKYRELIDVNIPVNSGVLGHVKVA